MPGFGQVVTAVSLLLFLGLLWYVRHLKRDVRNLKREWYYQQQSLKGIPQDIRNSVDTLRLQVSSLAAGRRVSPDLIQSGRLFHELSPAEVAQILEDPRHQQENFLLDVRSPGEFSQRRLPGATLIPVEQLDTRCQKELPSSARRIIVYCNEGDRSRLACDFLSRQGFTNLYYLRGGLTKWPGLLEGEGTGPLIQITPKTGDSVRQAAS